MSINKKIEKLIDQLGCEGCKYCFWKQFAKSVSLNPYNIVQLKCIEKFKWEESEKEKKDIGWNEAGFRWIEKGYAEKFEKCFNENKSFKKIYQEIVEE